MIAALPEDVFVTIRPITFRPHTHTHTHTHTHFAFALLKWHADACRAVESKNEDFVWVLAVYSRSERSGSQQIASINVSYAVSMCQINI